MHAAGVYRLPYSRESKKEKARIETAQTEPTRGVLLPRSRKIGNQRRSKFIWSGVPKEAILGLFSMISRHPCHKLSFLCD